MQEKVVTTLVADTCRDAIGDWDAFSRDSITHNRKYIAMTTITRCQGCHEAHGGRCIGRDTGLAQWPSLLFDWLAGQLSLISSGYGWLLGRAAGCLVAWLSDYQAVLLPDCGHLEAWKPGSLEAWKLGSLEAWKPGSLEAWKPGSLEA